MVSLLDVTKDFTAGDQTVRAVDGVSLQIERGDVFGVIGYSGAGKSTLVRLINALELPTSGSIVVDDVAITGRTERELRPARARIGFIFQQFNLLNSRSVAGNVGYPLQVAHWPKERRQARVAELLDFVGLADKARQYPDQLSGGRSSGSASRGRWQHRRRCCSPTRPPAPLTRRRRGTCSTCSAGSTPSWGSPSW